MIGKPFLSGVICCLLSLWSMAQSATLDKNKLFSLLQEQQFDAAISYLQPAIGADSSNAEALRQLAYAHYMNEDMLRAQQCFLKLVSLDSLHLTANHYLAVIYYNRDPDIAMSHLQRLIRLQPQNAGYHRSLGELLSRAKQKDSALVLLKQAYALAPNDFKNLVALAEVYIDLKEYPCADSLLEVGWQRDSLNASVLKSTVRSAYETKDYKRVTRAGERLLEIVETSSATLTKVALAHYNLQQYQDCVRICEYMFKIGLEIEAVYYYEAKSLAKLKDYTQSNVLLEICLDKAISKNAEMYYFGLAENYEAIRQYKKAVAMYDTAYYMFKTPLALYNCGRIYEVELKNETLARQYYRRYLTIARPEAPDEKKAYAWVKEKWGKK